MCKYGLLKKKDIMKDGLAYVDNPVEAEFPGHWLPVSILKKIMEMRAYAPAKLSKQTILNLKLFVTQKYTKRSPNFVFTDTKLSAKIAPTAIDNVIEAPTKPEVIKSLIPKNFKRPVTLLSTIGAKNNFETYTSDLPTKFSKLITDSKTNQSAPNNEPEATDISGKTVIESHNDLTSVDLTTTDGMNINNKTIDAITTLSTVPETAPELQSLNLTTVTTTPVVSTQITTESITVLSEKSTAIIKTVSTAGLTETPTTELTTNSATKEVTKEITKESESKNVLTTDVTTKTYTETGNPFY